MSGSGGSPIGIGIGIWSQTQGAGIAPTTPSWVLTADGAPAAIDFDFANNRAYVLGATGTPDSFLTCSRSTTRYVVNSGGNYVTAAINTLGYTYNPLTVAAQGIWDEEARINGIRNNSMQGTVVGSPGTPPNNWSPVLDATLALNVIAQATQNNIEYVDLQLVGVSTGLTDNIINFDTTTGISALTAETRAESAFLEIVGGDLTGINSIKLRQSERTVAGALVLNNDSPALTLATSGNLAVCQQSYIVTYSGGATTARTQPALVINTAVAGVVNITIRIGWPQLELGASVTSPIRTTAGAASRSADVVSMSLPAALQSLSAYSEYTQMIPNSPTAFPNNQTIVSLDNGTTAQRISLARAGTTGIATILDTIGGGPGATVWNQNTSGKLAQAVQSGSQATSFNGGAVTTASGVGAPTPITTLHIGCNGVTTGSSLSQIARSAIFNFRVSNAALVTMTT